MSDNLTKKQKKALEFRQKKSSKRPIEEVEPGSPKEEPVQVEENQVAEPQVKKRKTRRGKKGKTPLDQEGPRFILFVGNLPYTIKEQELKDHFKSSKPDRIRIRQDKGIAFLEFRNKREDLKQIIDTALRRHHTILNDRKINVELTAGGGGNSKDRAEKIKQKNEKLVVERRERISKEMKDNAAKRQAENKTSEAPSIHPSRAALLKK